MTFSDVSIRFPWFEWQFPIVEISTENCHFGELMSRSLLLRLVHSINDHNSKQLHTSVLNAKSKQKKMFIHHWFFLSIVCIQMLIVSIRASPINIDSDPNHLLTNFAFDDVDELGTGKFMLYNDKRELGKKWAKLFQDSHSPYTIAFPALIRSRRFVPSKAQWCDGQKITSFSSSIHHLETPWNWIQK